MLTLLVVKENKFKKKQLRKLDNLMKSQICYSNDFCL